VASFAESAAAHSIAHNDSRHLVNHPTYQAILSYPAQDRSGRFSTELFERYQRSERAQ